MEPEPNLNVEKEKSQSGEVTFPEILPLYRPIVGKVLVTALFLVLSFSLSQGLSLTLARLFIVQLSQKSLSLSSILS